MRRKCLSLAILTFLLAGCNNANSSNNSNNNNNIDCFIKNKTTIQFLCLTDGNFKAELERMINEFKSVDGPIRPLLDDIKKFTRDAEQFDDMTLLYLKIKG